MKRQKGSSSPVNNGHDPSHFQPAARVFLNPAEWIAEDSWDWPEGTAVNKGDSGAGDPAAPSRPAGCALLCVEENDRRRLKDEGIKKKKKNKNHKKKQSRDVRMVEEYGGRGLTRFACRD